MKSRSFAVGTLDKVEEPCWGDACAGEDEFEVVGADGFGDNFAEDLAEVGGDGEVAAFVELLVVQAGPAAVDFAAFDLAAEDEHGVGVAVVGAAGAVLRGRCGRIPTW